MAVALVRKVEHETFELPVDHFLVNGRLQVYEEVQRRGYFQIRASGDKLVFQAGGFIGLIPINDRVTIEVAPRTPIANLDRLLRIGNAESAVIRRITRSYAETDEDLSLVDVLADELSDSMEQIAADGRLKTYEANRRLGHPRTGRILVKETLRERAAHPGAVRVATQRFERTSSNVFNACLKLSHEALSTQLRTGKLRKGWAERVRRLNQGWQLVADADGRLVHEAALERVRGQLEQLPSEAYRRAVALSVAVLSSRMPSARLAGGAMTLSSVVYDLSDAFEVYVRNVLALANRPSVRDGNLAPPVGGKLPLFGNPLNVQIANISATPDIVLVANGEPWCAIDVKYKPFAASPGRDDLNQVLTYGLSHSVDVCVLVYPASPTLQGLQKIGEVGPKHVYGYGLDLNAGDLASAEAAMSAAIFALH